MSVTATASDRQASTTTHPLYGVWQPEWTKLAHVYEGSGGFLDGTYLVAHPREWQDYTSPTPATPTKKLLARRRIARYENVAATILDQLRSALFRGQVVRRIGENEDSTKKHKLNTWWSNVDGKQTAIGDYMAQSWTPCGLFGSIVHLMDRPGGEKPQTKADEQAPYLRTYTPLDLADWLTDDMGCVTAVKLLECEPRTDLKQSAAVVQTRERLITDETWEVISKGVHVNGDAHGFGRVPVVIQYAKRRALQSVLGQSVLGDPQLYIDDYNLTSELRELLRNQTFSMLNVVLGTGPDRMSVEDAIKLLTSMGGTGTENVIFSAGDAKYITADTANVEVYQKERNELRRTMYRLASIPWESDSRDAEAEGSLKLKREDMNQVLASYADECEKAEYQFVELWFRAEYGPARWKSEYDAAKVVITYPDTFDVTPFAEILEQAQAAVALEMPPTFMKELRKRLVAKFLPDASPDVIKAIDKELDDLATNGPQGLERKVLEAVGRFQKGSGMPPQPEDGAVAA